MKNLLHLVLRIALFSGLLLAFNLIAKLVYLENLESGIYTNLTDSSGARLFASNMITSTAMLLLIIEEIISYLGKVLRIVRRSNVLNLAFVSMIAVIGFLAVMLILSAGFDWVDADHLKVSFAAFSAACLIGFMIARQVCSIRNLHVTNNQQVA